MIALPTAKGTMLLDDTLEQMEIALRVLPLAEEITGYSKFGLAVKQKVQ